MATRPNCYAWFAVTAVLAACAELAPIEADVCGNGILESGEDCDLVADDALGEDLACGVPADAIEQRCRFVCAANSCPAGWGCGDDGVCRHGTGGYEEVGRTDMPADQLAAGDIDGDGLLDLLGVGATGVAARFGNGDLTFPTALSPQTSNQTGLSSMGDIDGDGRLDLAVPLGLGLAISRGTDERRLAPIASSLSVDAFVPNSQLGQVLAFRRGAFEGTPPADAAVVVALANGTAMFSTGPGQTALAAELDGILGDARPATANINALGAGPPHEQVMLAFAGDDRARLYDLFGPGDVRLTAQVQLPTGLVFAVGGQPGPTAVNYAIFADENTDGLVDVLLAGCPATQVQQGFCRVADRVAVAHGDGLGGFTPAAVEPRFDAIAADCVAPGQCRTLPVAAADLNGDGVTDYIAERSAYLDSAGALLRTAPLATDAPWSIAEVGDFNRDGNVDVAGATLLRDGLDIALGVGDGFFNVQQASTTLDVIRMRVGDFDGDFASDIAVAEIDGSDNTSTVSVIFGVVDGNVGAPVLMLELGLVTGLEAGFDVGAAQASGDRISDLVIASLDPIDERTVITFLSGVADRTMVTTFGLPRATELGLQVPIGAAIGDFLADEPGNEVIAIADSQDPTLWVLPATSDGEIEPPQPTDGQALAGRIGAFAPGCARWLAVDLNGDGIDELIGHGGQSLQSATFRACRDLGPTETAQDILIARVSGTAHVPVLDLTTVAMPTSVFGVTAMVFTDLDGDGNTDLIAAYDGDGSPSLDGVLVYWGSGSGLDGTTTALPLPARAARPGAPQVSEPPSIALVGADDDPTPELAIVLSDGVYLAEFDGRTPTVTDVPAAPATFFPLQFNRARTAIVTGDFDRDGVDDLIVGDGSDARAFRGIPHTEVAP